MTTITLRNYREMNAKMHGEEVHQQIAYASAGWATWHWINEAPTAIDVGPRMPPRGIRASERRCAQIVELGVEVGDLCKEIITGGGYKIWVYGGTDTAGKPVWIRAPNQDAAARQRAKEAIAAQTISPQAPDREALVVRAAALRAELASVEAALAEIDGTTT